VPVACRFRFHEKLPTSQLRVVGYHETYFSVLGTISFFHTFAAECHEILSPTKYYTLSLSLSLSLIAGTVTFSVPDFRRSLESALHRRAKSFLPQDVRRSDIRYLSRALSRLSDIVDILKIIS